MKAVLALLVVIISCQASAESSVSEKWEQFQRDFEKTYKSPVEARTRYAIFQQKLKDIEEHNIRYANGEVSWKKGINQFSDWKSEEFMQYVNKFKFTKTIKKSEAASKFAKYTNIPESRDWRTEGAVSRVKDQGSCGSCWAFSATGALEGQFKLIKNVTVSLSEQNLIDCANEKHGTYFSMGCEGGVIVDGYRYAEDEGIATEQDYPYQEEDGECSRKTKVYKVDAYLPVHDNENELLEAVGIIGPISVGIEATSNLQDYKEGVLYDENCSGKLNHGVLAVGYGSENGNDYWLVKNSWGAKWGEDGYFKLARKNNNCGIANSASYPIIFE